MATPKAQLKKPIGQLSTGGLNHALKTVKMVQARCNECNPRGQGPRGWWENCPHEPYFSMVPAAPPKSKFEEQEDGTFVQVGMETPKYVKRPNWKQIADDAKITSGRMVQIQRERGSKFPGELGYAPICDYFNCWEINPGIHATRVIGHEGIQTVVGNYHTREEAAMLTLRAEGTPIFIGVDSDIQRRRKQLSETNVT
jgi:hypothetical protein